MTSREMNTKNSRAGQLKVLQSDDGKIFVESSNSKILYNVKIEGDQKSCTCEDFTRNSKQV